MLGKREGILLYFSYFSIYFGSTFLRRPFSEMKKNNSRISVAGTSFVPWKFARDMGSSSHWMLIMMQGQETNRDNFGKSFCFSTLYTIIVCRVYRGDFYEYTRRTIS